MMFGTDRAAMRRYYRDAWRKHLAGELLQPLESLIATVVAEHPEYHRWLDDAGTAEQEFPPDAGHSNPYLHMGMHIALREQVSTDRPVGIAGVHRDLCKRLGSAGAAEHRMMECLGEALWSAQRDNRAPDEQAYLSCLRRL